MAHYNYNWQQIQSDLSYVKQHLADPSTGRILVFAVERIVERVRQLEQQVSSLEQRVTKLEQLCSQRSDSNSNND